MTQDEIIEMAKLAGFEMDNSCVISPQNLWYIYQEQLETFAKLVAEKAHEEFGLPAVGILERTVARAVAKEREACINVIETHRIPVGNSAAGEMACEWTYDALKEIRTAIRARGEA